MLERLLYQIFKTKNIQLISYSNINSMDFLKMNNKSLKKQKSLNQLKKMEIYYITYWIKLKKPHLVEGFSLLFLTKH
ncbi:unnamed protein product [Paramecium sonneborni]|uniref:Uncharacterized protein n=1 Tax=Paramecium sonneborni TaxID=65129 RepID=A0A8S1KTR9_9CILI|nr:unnamed protein product [Paramecium sonneborni]